MMTILNRIATAVKYAGLVVSWPVRYAYKTIIENKTSCKSALTKAGLYSVLAAGIFAAGQQAMNERIERNKQAFLTVTSLSAVADLEQIINQELDSLHQAGASLNNHPIGIDAVDELDEKIVAKRIESEGMRMYNQEFEPIIKKEAMNRFAPLPRAGIGEQDGNMQIYKLLIPFLAFGILGSMTAQFQLTYRKMIAEPGIIKKAARFCVLSSIIYASPIISDAGVRGYLNLKPRTNNYVPAFSEISVRAEENLPTPYDVALALYHESCHHLQSRSRGISIFGNSIFMEGEARMKELSEARRILKQKNDAGYLESVETRVIPELMATYLIACRRSGVPPNIGLFVRYMQEARNYRHIGFDEHAIGTALYMIASKKAGPGILKEEKFDSVLAAAQN